MSETPAKLREGMTVAYTSDSLIEYPLPRPVRITKAGVFMVGLHKGNVGSLRPATSQEAAEIGGVPGEMEESV